MFPSRELRFAFCIKVFEKQSNFLLEVAISFAEKIIEFKPVGKYPACLFKNNNKLQNK